MATEQTIIESRALTTLLDGGYSVWQAWPLDIEYTKTEDGRFIIWGDPLHVKTALAVEAVKKRFARTWKQIREDDEDAWNRHFEAEWRALHRAVAPVFADLLRKKKRGHKVGRAA